MMTCNTLYQKKSHALQYRSYPVICKDSCEIVFKKCLGNTSVIATTSTVNLDLNSSSLFVKQSAAIVRVKFQSN